MSNWINDLLDLLFPRYCIMCGKRLTRTEEHLCVSCISDLPRTNNYKEKDPSLEQLFWGRAKIERVAAYFTYYKDNIACRILAELKYNHYPEIGVFMGKLIANEIKGSSFLQDIDLLVPVPLAASKQKKRGYNQCEMIAIGVSKVTSIPINTSALTRPIANPTQTKKRRIERWENVQGIFSVKNAEELTGKHILLIDDVITTGATLISCIEALSEVPNLTISILTLAVARE